MLTRAVYPLLLCQPPVGSAGLILRIGSARDGSAGKGCHLQVTLEEVKALMALSRRNSGLGPASHCSVASSPPNRPQCRPTVRAQVLLRETDLGRWPESPFQVPSGFPSAAVSIPHMGSRAPTESWSHL